MMDPSRLRSDLTSRVLDATMHAAARAVRHVPAYDPGRGASAHLDESYGAPHPSRRLDVYVPDGDGPFPIAFYVHGGGFRIGSRRSHAPLAGPFTRAGFLTVLVEYRLAPRHPFPAALEDVCAAYLHVLDHAARLRGDPTRVVVAGESAGGNLTLALGLAACAERPEPYARAVYDRDVVPRVLLPMCGILQVSDIERFGRRGPVGRLVRERMMSVSRSYLAAAAPAHGFDLADPLLVLERGDRLARPLPPVFASVGARDPILEDTRRLAAELARRGAAFEAPEYAGEHHAFQAFLPRAAARAHWRDALSFVSRHLDGEPRAASEFARATADAVSG